MKPIKVALVGCGKQAHENLLPCLAMIPEISLEAVCDLDLELAKLTCQQYGISSYFNNAEEMIHSLELEAVILAGPPKMHAEVGLKAIHKGLHVFLEKPASDNLQDLAIMVDAIHDTNLISMVGHNFRYAQPVIAVEGLMQQKKFGFPKFISVRFLSNKPRQPIWDYSSLLWTQLMMMATHPIDLMELFLGGVASVYSTASEQENGMLILTSTMEFVNGGLGFLYVGSNSPRFEVNVEISDHLGQILTIDDLWDIQFRKRPEDEQGFNKLWSMHWRPSPLNGGYERSGYYNELQQFALAIRTNQPVRPSLDDFWDTLRVCYAIGKSVQERRKVLIDEIQIGTYASVQ